MTRFPIQVRQNHKPLQKYDRDELKDIKVNLTTHTRLAMDKAEYGLRNLDELINPALDALRREWRKK